MLNKAVINLSTIKANALKVKNILKDKKLCAVVKADAYGHGAEMVASALYKTADCFAVALVEEGVKLRLSGIDKEILVLIPPFNCDVEKVVRYGLTVAVQSKKIINLLQGECERQNAFCTVHIAYNTGMNRLGVDDVSSLYRLIEEIDKSNRVVLGGVFSHLGNSRDKRAVKTASDKFLLANNVVKGYNKNAVCHLSASGGLLQGEIFDMARVGILLYGYLPYETDLISVKPAMKVYAPSILSRTVDNGKSVMYGDYLSEGAQTYSVIRYGYADGLERKGVLGQLNDRCMDLTAVKGNERFYCVMDNAEVLAERYGTISYEILCKSAFRAERVYIR